MPRPSKDFELRTPDAPIATRGGFKTKVCFRSNELGKEIALRVVKNQTKRGAKFCPHGANYVNSCGLLGFQ